MAGLRPSTELVLRPGDDFDTSLRKGTPAGISVPGQYVSGQSNKPTDAGDGTFTLPGLIPGATYVVWAQDQGAAGGSSRRLTFTAPPTGSADLGTLTVFPGGPGRRD